MKVVICGSIAHYQNMLELRDELMRRGHSVIVPPTEIQNGVGSMIPVSEYYVIRHSLMTEPKISDDMKWVFERKSDLIRDYFEKINEGDSVLVANYEKNGIEGYIGGNTLMEMSVAFYLGKPIYLVNDIPSLSYREEILAMNPVVIDRDISRVMGV